MRKRYKKNLKSAQVLRQPSPDSNHDGKEELENLFPSLIISLKMRLSSKTGVKQRCALSSVNVLLSFAF